MEILLDSEQRPSFDMQVDQLMLNNEKFKSVPEITHTIEDTLKTTWPGCKVVPFGSQAYGLGLSSCDIDIKVFLSPCYNTSDVELLYQTKAAFENYSDVYQDITIKATKKVALIKLYFKPANILCDISLKATTSVYESDLLHHLLDMDKRALRLAFIIKYWARLQNLTTGDAHLSNYALMLLVIFFLQQRLILPAVMKLQKDVQPLILDSIDGPYNVAFERKRNVCMNNDSLYSLLGEFFKFYEAFNFAELVVSPFIGQPISRHMFKHLDRVPDVFRSYKMNVVKNMTGSLDVETPMCIQSIFVHSDNCAGRVNTCKLDMIQRSIINTAELYRKGQMCNFLSEILNTHIM